MAKGMVGLYVDADMTEGIQAGAAMSHFIKRMSSTAHRRTVVSTTHTVFADMFNQEINAAARLSPDRYHHVYEYSPGGTGYEDIGRNQSRLWDHVIQYRGSNANFSWNWRPARQYNPTYHQRRAATVGWDAIRHISNEEFLKLVEHSEGRRHRFIWKAPMLEHAIPAQVNAKGRFLALPTFTTGGAKMMFRPWVTSVKQQPGDTKGNFTKMWAWFWRVRVPQEWDRVIGQEIETDAARKIVQAATKGKKANKAKRDFSFSVVTNTREAMLAGRQQAEAAFKSHQKSISAIERVRRTL